MKSLALILALMSQWDPRDVVPEQERLRMRNQDGSCVQCSIAIAGIHHANANAEMLLFDSAFGPPARGGSWPGRVAEFAKSRGLEIWQIEGEQTINWIEWALSTNRYVALSFDPYHFQTAVGMAPDRKTFYVVDNNRPTVVQQLDRATFLRRHNSSGRWAVILKGPSPPPWIGPEFVKWWPKVTPRKPTHVPKPTRRGGLGFDRTLF